MREPTLAGGYARALIQLAVSKGASREPLIERFGMDPRLLEDQDSRIPLPNYVALMRAGKALSGDWEYVARDVSFAIRSSRAGQTWMREAVGAAGGAG